jgi:uncharacterized membrane protein YadS
MAYLISIGSTVCGTTAIMATAPVIKANKNEVSYAIANITSIWNTFYVNLSLFC